MHLWKCCRTVHHSSSQWQHSLSVSGLWAVCRARSSLTLWMEALAINRGPSLLHPTPLLPPHSAQASTERAGVQVSCRYFVSLFHFEHAQVLQAFSAHEHLKSLCFCGFLCLEGSESITRESVVSGLTSVSSTVPIARFSEEEKRVSVIKAPHYEGIGPVDESGIPIAIRTVSFLVKMSPEPAWSVSHSCPDLPDWLF